MIRFPNPGSDINQLISIFKLLYTSLSTAKSFNLDNMASVMANANVASSSGYIGSQALERSYEHTDNSRNPMYNQAKMYAEVYRVLGWIVSGENAALEFSFTYLGIHVATAGDNSGKLFEQCLLGINYPNRILDVKFKDINKPFLSFLYTADELDGIICRDEILIGPMNLSNSGDASEFNQSIAVIKSLRSTNRYSSLDSHLKDLTKSLGISEVTAKNYTRFVISSLKFTGWFSEVESDVYGTRKTFLGLTPKGRDLLIQLESTKSISGDEISTMDETKIRTISKIGFLQMLKRADFLVDNELSAMSDEQKLIENEYGHSEILFSPYQYFDKLSITKILPEFELDTGDEKVDFSVGKSDSKNYTFESAKSVGLLDKESSKHSRTKAKLLDTLAEANNNTSLAVSAVDSLAINMKQSEFYPFVADLFQIILDSEARAPQAGVNNERFDVIIPDSEYSIPAEVKSPTEEMMLSVKAIRQAVENKVVLLSRYTQHYPTQLNISSFAVGFNIPNERSDVYRLIEDIYNTYSINVSIVDVRTLVTAAYYCLANKKSYKISDFKDVRGVMSFANL